MREVVVFSGSAHQALAHRICDELGVGLSQTLISRFSNDCLQAQLLANCRQRDVYIVQPLVPPTQDSLMELLLMIDAARGASAAMITAVIPHFAYARSDKKDASRISLGGRLVADLISTAGADRVLTMNLHAPQVHGFFSVPVDHLTALGVLADHFRRQELDDCVVVSPDLGNAKDATQFSRLLGLPVAAGSKRRLGDDRVVIDSIVGDVDGKRAIVLDDEIATGGSIVELLDRLADHGVTEAAVACTHGLFAGRAVERLRSHPMVSEVVTTDTVPAPVGWPELKVRSVAGLFAEAIKRIHEGESVVEPVRRRRPDARPAAAELAVRPGALVSRALPAPARRRPRPALRRRRPAVPRRGARRGRGRPDGAAVPRRHGRRLAAREHHPGQRPALPGLRGGRRRVHRGARHGLPAGRRRGHGPVVRRRRDDRADRAPARLAARRPAAWPDRGRRRRGRADACGQRY